MALAAGAAWSLRAAKGMAASRSNSRTGTRAIRSALRLSAARHVGDAPDPTGRSPRSTYTTWPTSAAGRTAYSLPAGSASGRRGLSAAIGDPRGPRLGDGDAGRGPARRSRSDPGSSATCGPGASVRAGPSDPSRAEGPSPGADRDPDRRRRRPQALAWRPRRARASAARLGRFARDGRPRPGVGAVHAPSYAFQAPGGGENQLVQTARHLEARGVAFRLFSPWIDRIEDHRLLHLFGMSREGLELARVAGRRGLPVVLSPICWLEPERLYCPGAEPDQRGLGPWRSGRSSGPSPRLGGWRDDLIRRADVDPAQLGAEADQLVRFFRARPERSASCPTASMPGSRRPIPDSSGRSTAHRDFVLYAGRIEPRKNVLGLIRAAIELGRPVVVHRRRPAGSRGVSLSSARRRAAGWSPGIAGVEHDDPCSPRPMRRPASSHCRAGSRPLASPRSRRL